MIACRGLAVPPRTRHRGLARRHPSPPDLTRFRRFPRVRRTRVDPFAGDCERAAAPKGFQNAADLRMADCAFGLGQRRAIRIPLLRPQPPHRGAAGLALRPPGSDARLGRARPFRAGTSCVAGASTARSRKGPPPYPSRRAESATAFAGLHARPQHFVPGTRPAGPPGAARDLGHPAAANPFGLEPRQRFAVPPPRPAVDRRTETGSRGRSDSSSSCLPSVLRPPCSRKRPFLGGHGVKSTRRVRSVSTISRFSRFRLGSFSWPGPGPSRDCPGWTQDWARPLSGWVRAKPLSGRSMGLGRDGGCTHPYPVGGMG